MPEAVDLSIAHLDCESLGTVAVIEGWVEEALSRPTRASLRVAAPAVLDAKASFFAEATVRCGLASADRTFALRVIAVRWLGERGGNHLHEIELAHPAQRLALRGGRRVFQEKTTADIVKLLLDAAQVDADVQAPGRTHVYCAQHDESDLDFVCRLLEDDGITWVCTPTGGITAFTAKTGFTKLEVDPLPLVDVDTRGMAVTAFSIEHRATADAVVLADWNFETPQLDLTVDAQLSAEARIGIVEYPGGYSKSSDGAALAKIRAEELAAAGVIGEGTSNCLAFAAGSIFELSESSREDANAEWLLRSVRHLLRQAGDAGRPSYENEFVCSPHARPFRPARVTARPCDRSVDVAVVSAPSGEEIQTDQYGRLRAHFRWDRDGKNDGKDSGWMRVLQPAVGGTMFLGRTGWEVFVRYLDGDPSRPIAIGRADHAQHPTAYALPADKTKTAFRTLSSPGGKKQSEIRFEDKDGSMELYFHAAKEWDEHVRNDKRAKIGKDESVDIGKESFHRVDKTQTVDIGKGRTATIGGTDLVRVVGDRTTAVTGDEKLTIKGNVHEKVLGKDEETVGASATTKAKEEIGRTSKGKWTLQVGGAAQAEAGATHTIAVAGGFERTIGGAAIAKIAKSSSDQVGKDVTVTIGAVSLRVANGKRVVSSEGKATWTVGGAVALTAVSKLQLTGKKVKITIGGALVLSGGGAILNLTPASASIVGMVTANASGEVIVSGNPNLVG